MVFNIFRSKAKRERHKNDLLAYSILMSQAREPVFYKKYSIPDTLDGRYEMLVLHVFLYCYRLKFTQSPEKESAQRIFDLMVKGVDGALREMGVGDLSVGKKIKPMIEIFYGRTAAYDSALQSNDTSQLVDALKRNIYATNDDAENYAKALALYVEESVKHLATFNDKQIAAGEFAFPSQSAA